MRTRAAFAERSGLSAKTLGEIERAERRSYDPATIATVEQALRWPPGRVEAILRADRDLDRLVNQMREVKAGQAIARWVETVRELSDLLDDGSPLPLAERERLA